MKKQKTILEKAIDHMREDKEFFGVDGACPALFEDGNPKFPTLLISGENAGGKTILCRYIRQAINAHFDSKDKPEFMRVGMEIRSEPGMHRAFMFGDESWQSTGQITVGSLKGGVTTSRERSSPHTLCFDEPDIGLSEGYQSAVGDFLVQYALDMPEMSLGLIVVTHSRLIASKFADINAHMIRVGDDLRPTKEWLRDGPISRSIEDLNTLSERALNRFRAVDAITTRRTKARNEAEERAKTDKKGSTNNSSGYSR